MIAKIIFRCLYIDIGGNLIMKCPIIQTIRAMYHANKPIVSNPKGDVINIKNELDPYYTYALKKVYPELNAYAADRGIKLNIAQRGESLLINSGAKTTSLSKDKITDGDSVREAIIKNINLTA